MSENGKYITKYVVLKVTYNSFFIENPESWDWNELVGCEPDENVSIISVRDFPPPNEF
jgi:hypothetical protein